MLDLTQPFLAPNDSVICFGDSLTAAKDGYVSLLQERMKQHKVINAGRGGSQVEADIGAALEKGILGAASLDVFEQEPLSAESSLWGFDNVVVTPHAAAASDVSALFRHVERQISRFESGEPLENVVDRAAGY